MYSTYCSYTFFVCIHTPANVYTYEEERNTEKIYYYPDIFNWWVGQAFALGISFTKISVTLSWKAIILASISLFALHSTPGRKDI